MRTTFSPNAKTRARTKQTHFAAPTLTCSVFLLHLSTLNYCSVSAHQLYIHSVSALINAIKVSAADAAAVQTRPKIESIRMTIAVGPRSSRKSAGTKRSAFTAITIRKPSKERQKPKSTSSKTQDQAEAVQKADKADPMELDQVFRFLDLPGGAYFNVP